MKTARYNDRMYEPVDGLLRAFNQYLGGKGDVLCCVSRIVFDPDMVVRDAGINKRLGVLFCLSVVFIDAIATNTTTNQEIVDNAASV